jgi:uncharacterized protein YdeI (YjbR/CyaY-like superfamily)
MKATFFETARDFRAWLEAHHATERQLVVGYYKRASGKPSMTWPESVDEALCFGWIDGVRKSLSEDAYSIRFTPRKRTSNWSAINVARVAALESLGRMTPAGRRSFEARTPERTGVYSFERNTAAVFSPEEERRFRAHPAAASFFDAQPPGYRRTVTHWVISAKRDATRARRLEQLIEDCAQGRRLGIVARPVGKKAARSSTGKRSATKANGASARSAKTQMRKPRSGKKVARSGKMVTGARPAKKSSARRSARPRSPKSKSA